MITLIRIQNFRCFADIQIKPQQGLNVLVGDNESGKSTILQALTLALTGRWNGQWALEELTSDWFHRPTILSFFESWASGVREKLPQIEIEVYLDDPDDALQKHRGVNNSLNQDGVGLRLCIAPSDEYADEITKYLNTQDCPRAVPVEYYEADWRNFADELLTRQPAGLGHVLIDSRTIRSQRGVDYHTREMLHGFIEPAERASISVAHRQARHDISTRYLDSANARIREQKDLLGGRDVQLDFEQSSATSWHTSVIPRIDDIPFSLAGQGAQAEMKIALAMSRTAVGTSFVLVEEPENHLSHTRLMRLVASIERLAGDRQSFLTTHSSFVLNRLGLDRLFLLSHGRASRFEELSQETVRYFKRLSGFDTLRLALAERLVLVEGPSDEIVFERLFRDRYEASPSDRGVDIVSIRGIALRRSLELCAALDRQVVAIRDNDGKEPEHWIAPVKHLLKDGVRELVVGRSGQGDTLEPQLVAANGEDHVAAVLGRSEGSQIIEWMLSNKTEAALRILESSESLSPPPYMSDALDLLE